MSYFENLTIRGAIVHKVFDVDKTNLTRNEPELSDTPLNFKVGAKEIFVNRITNVLSRGSKCIEMDIDNNDDTHAIGIGRKLLSNPQYFVECSQSLVKKYHEDAGKNQNRSGGILIVFDGTSGPENEYRFWGLIKADKQDAFEYERNGNKNDIEINNNLFLSSDKKLYKLILSFAYSEITEDGEEFLNERPFVFDLNMQLDERAGPAKYFYDTFLSLKLAESSAKHTRDFLEITKEFANKNNDLSQEDKINLIEGVKAELRSNDPTINTKSIADKFIPEKMSQVRDYYSSTLESKGIPINDFVKDVKYITRLLRFSKAKFTSGLNVSGNSDTFHKNFIIGEYDDQNDFTSAKIKGKLKGIDS